MSKLIQMRSKIQTIETIRKVTDAMRIISMSAHSRLKVRQEPLNNYMTKLAKVLAKVQIATPSWSHERLMPAPADDNNPLIILVGSQKGLCGGFNSFLSKYFNQYLSEHASKRYQYIAVGKKALDYLQTTHTDRIVSSFPTLTTHNFLTIAQKITDLIMNVTPQYTSVTIFSNVFKSFFVQKPTLTHLIPFNPHSIDLPIIHTTNEDYTWDEQPATILDTLAVHYIEAQIQNLIFQSLLSEHAARFISMDNSTRNANNLLEATKREYNKLRQAKITTEITELTGSF